MSVPSTAISTPTGNCSDGELRLEGSSDDMQAGTREGRVEICINNAWGTVCDTLFRREDAAVVCEQLEGFQRSGESCAVVIPKYLPRTHIHACKLGNRLQVLPTYLSSCMLRMDLCDTLLMLISHT